MAFLNPDLSTPFFIIDYYHNPRLSTMTGYFANTSYLTPLFWYEDAPTLPHLWRPPAVKDLEELVWSANGLMDNDLCQSCQAVFGRSTSPPSFELKFKVSRRSLKRSQCPLCQQFRMLIAFEQSKTMKDDPRSGKFLSGLLKRHRDIYTILVEPRDRHRDGYLSLVCKMPSETWYNLDVYAEPGEFSPSCNVSSCF
jgi:hypothetical protein